MLSKWRTDDRKRPQEGVESGSWKTSLSAWVPNRAYRPMSAFVNVLPGDGSRQSTIGQLKWQWLKWRSCHEFTFTDGGRTASGRIYFLYAEAFPFIMYPVTQHSTKLHDKLHLGFSITWNAGHLHMKYDDFCIIHCRTSSWFTIEGRF